MNEATEIDVLTHLPIGAAMMLEPIVTAELRAGRGVVCDDTGAIFLDAVAPSRHREMIRIASAFPRFVSRGDDARAWRIEGAGNLRDEQEATP